jgi:signal transduction histidine kinase
MLTRSLAGKLMLAFLAVALTTALLVAVFIRVTNASQLDQLVVEQQRSNFQTMLVDYYQAKGSWDGVWAAVNRNIGAPPPQGTPEPGRVDYGPGGGGRGPDHRQDRHNLFGLVDSRGIVIIPLLPDYPSGLVLQPAALAQGTPVTVDGQVVGTILTARLPPGLSPEESAFLTRTNWALVLAGLGAVLVAVLVGFVLARSLTRPLHDLTLATNRLAAGELEQAVMVNSSDEIGRLSQAFNQMSRELARANQARRQMTADIAHELRTPLTVVAGYIESMADGVLEPTPERLAIIHAELEHLQQLVRDMRVLTQADAGELTLTKEMIEPADLLQRAQAAFKHQADLQGVSLEVQLPGAPQPVEADETRLAQVLSNLLSNALRYTAAGGRIVLGAVAHGGTLTLSVQDTGKGIAPADLPFIFNRFYQADQSRSEENGESGLGLAIARALVEAHGGTIEAQSELGRGSTFLIHLPLAAGPEPSKVRI